MNGTTIYTLAKLSSSVAPYYLADKPASVQANPIILMFSIFGLLGGTMLAFETLWRIAGQARADRHPWWHPVTAFRVMVGSFMLSLLCYIGPDAVVFMAWPDIMPETRYDLAIINRILDSVALLPLAFGWVLGVYVAPTIDYQLRRDLDRRDLWPLRKQLRRPLWICFLILTISMVLAFGR